jgi:hypothetical protein
MGTATICKVSDQNRRILEQKYPHTPWHRTPESRAYISAKTKCESTRSPYYEDNGQRGIKCLYRDLDHFLTDVGMRPTENHVLDRLDRDKNYEPGNVQWVTKFESIRHLAAKPEDRPQSMAMRIVRALTKHGELTRQGLVNHCKANWSWAFVVEVLQQMIAMGLVGQRNEAVEVDGSMRTVTMFSLSQA